jgi:hypothetical protein
VLIVTVPVVIGIDTVFAITLSTKVKVRLLPSCKVPLIETPLDVRVAVVPILSIPLPLTFIPVLKVNPVETVNVIPELIVSVPV